MARNTYTDTTTNRLYEFRKPKFPKKKTSTKSNPGFGDVPNPFSAPPYVNTPVFGSGNQSLAELRNLQGIPDVMVNAYDQWKQNPKTRIDDPLTNVDPGLPGGYGGGSGGGGGGGDGSGGGSGDAGGKPWKGWSSQFAPGGADILYDRPEIMVRQKLKEMGFNTDAGIMDLIGQDAGDLQYLAMLTMGADPNSLNTQTDENFFNFAGDWAGNMATPGGSVPDTMAMLQSILDAPGGSALSAALANGTPQEQAQMLNNLVSVAAGGLTPLMQRALMGRMEDRTTDWLGDQAKGRDSTLADWLQRGGQGYLG